MNRSEILSYQPDYFDYPMAEHNPNCFCEDCLEQKLQGRLDVAQAEEDELAAIPTDLRRRAGFMALSVVARWNQAGQSEKARQRAAELAADATLPEWARESLRVIDQDQG